MKLKELKKTVNVSWSPAEHYPVLLAAGSAAQQVDASFSSTSTLELYSLNLDDPGLDLKVEASIQAQHKFQKLVWSGAGVIVGGCDSGLLQFYSTEKLLQNAADPLLGSVTKHTGQINALDINPYQKNLLASGASESEIFIWDLNNTSQPMAPGGRSQPHQPVQAVAWNQQVQHILGSTFATRCVVWDLRKNEPIMKLTDSVHGTRWRALTWHPSVATQLCVASEDDAASVLQLWDLRLAAAPLATLSGHHKGVTSAAWSARDPRLLLSGARDGRLLCWDPSAGHPGGEIVSEVYSSQQWVLDVSWSPRAPGLLASAGSEQGLAVHTLLGGSAPHISTQAQSNIMESFGGACSLGSLPAVADPPRAAPAQPVRPPAWMRRRAPATLAFGGKLVTVEKCPEEPGEPRKVYISQVVTEPDLVERAAELDNLLNDSLSSDPTAIERLAEYCGARGAAARAQHERCLWYLLRASFRDCFREELRELLGFKDDDILSRFKNATIGDTPTQNALLSREAQTLIERKLTDREDSPQPTNIMIPNGDDPTSLICRALVTGNLEAAVELCLESKMVADALIIASLSSPDLLLKVQRYHLSLNASSPVALLTRGLLTGAWERVVSGVAPAAWRVCLAALAPRPAPCELLGDKLSSEPAVGVDGATLCYVCAGAVDRAVSRLVQAGGARGERGARGARGEGGAGEGETDVDWLATLALVLRRSAQVRGREPQPGGPLESVLIRFAQRLADAGALEAALRSLQGVADTTLADRLMCALYGTPQTQQAPQSQTHAASLTHTHTRAQRDTHVYSAAPAPAPTACDTSRTAQPARPPSVTSQPGLYCIRVTRPAPHSPHVRPASPRNPVCIVYDLLTVRHAITLSYLIDSACVKRRVITEVLTL